MLAEVVSSTSPLRQMMRSLRRREKMSSAFRQSVRRTLRMKADAYMCANHLPDQSAGVL